MKTACAIALLVLLVSHLTWRVVQQINDDLNDQARHEHAAWVFAREIAQK